MMEYRRRQKLYYDRGSKPLKPIADNAIRVWTPNGWKPAEYIRQHALPNSHIIRAGEQGNLYRRNRKHLMTTAENPHVVRAPELNIPPVRLEHHRQVIQQPTPPEPPLPQAPTPGAIPNSLPRPPERSHVPPEPTRARSTRMRKDPSWMKDYVRT
jgi:hypothetical protein